MLERNSDSTVTYLKATFEGDVSILGRMNEAAKAINDRFKFGTWNPANGEIILMRDFKNRLTVIIQPNAILFHLLGTAFYYEQIKLFADGLRQSLRDLGLLEVTRLGFQATCWADIAMRESEILESMYNTFLAEKAKLHQLPGIINDVMLDLYGKVNQLNYRLKMAPQTPDQVKGTFFAIPNLELMDRERWANSTVSDFYKQIKKPSLFLEIDVSEDKCSLDRVTSFVTESYELADKIGEEAISILLGTPQLGSAS